MPPNALPLLQISTGSPEPLYRQLMDQVRRLVAAGHLRAGQELPSVRELSAGLAVNPMTVSKAYGLLETEGVLERRRGLAMVVAMQHRHALPAAARVALLRPTLERAAAEARDLELSPAQALALFKQVLAGGTDGAQG